MEIYKLPIEVAFIVFPFIAFILTIPFLIYQYNKYGAIPMVKCIVFYSMILYLITAYFMVILPLPSKETVSNLTDISVQLKPFNFIFNIKETTNFNIKDINSFINFLNTSTVYTVLFNILLTVPFGIFLKYLFDKKLSQTIIYSFVLSLFFELTQLSGLYGIYPNPYRLFDVDDLIINTFGGLVGYIITPIAQLFLPTRKELEMKSYLKGQKVTLLRRILAFLIDLLIISILSLCIKIFLYNNQFENYSYIISISIYYLIIPLITRGVTIGKMVVKIKVSGITKEIKWYKLLIRNIILIYIIIFPYTWISILEKQLNLEYSNILIIIIKIIIELFIMINILYYVINLPKRKRIFLYEKITNTQNISTIEIENKNEESENNENNNNKTLKKNKVCYNKIENKKMIKNKKTSE